jgi:hypothetical protein
MLPNLAKSLSGSSPLWLIEKTLLQVGPAIYFLLARFRQKEKITISKLEEK